MDQDLKATLSRIAEALARRAPPAAASADMDGAEAYVWHAAGHRLEAVPKVNRLPIELLKGVDHQKATLVENTQRFTKGLPANNPLLSRVRGSKRRFVVFCDDLSFDGQDAAYKSLKAVLEGGIEGRPDNVVFYATSNRRHLMPRDMIENERSTAISPSEAVEEKVSLSDRFGLWLGFHNADQDTFFAMIEGYANHYKLGVPVESLRKQAIEWSVTRGARSGRVAWQFIQELAGRLGQPLQ